MSLSEGDSEVFPFYFFFFSIAACCIFSIYLALIHEWAFKNPRTMDLDAFKTAVLAKEAMGHI